jgi:ribulose-5-phosphate 4-epimerase/fuculose-1-phosphate aldolase
MTIHPNVDQLLPPLDPRLELVLLARTLWREGYDDHLAGHITYRQPDGSLLTNPWYLLWDEFGVEDVVRIDDAGNVLEGRWPPAPGVKLHLALHELRPDVGVAIHNHPRFATVWANARRLPACLDQSSGLGGGRVRLVEEYKGTVANMDHARAAAAALGDADIALLGGHGLFVLGQDIPQAHLRAVAFEQRCRVGYQVESLGGGIELDPDVLDVLGRAEFPGFWEAMARRELRIDPALLDPALLGPARIGDDCVA